MMARIFLFSIINFIYHIVISFTISLNLSTYPYHSIFKSNIEVKTIKIQKLTEIIKYIKF